MENEILKMENQILIGILKSQLRIDAEWLNRIESLTAQIKELEAVPDNAIDPFTQKPYRRPYEHPADHKQRVTENGITIAKKHTTLAVTESDLIATIMNLIDQSFEKHEMIIPSKVNKAIQKELQENLIKSLSA